MDHQSLLTFLSVIDPFSFKFIQHILSYFLFTDSIWYLSSHHMRQQPHLFSSFWFSCRWSSSKHFLGRKSILSIFPLWLVFQSIILWAKPSTKWLVDLLLLTPLSDQFLELVGLPSTSLSTDFSHSTIHQQLTNLLSSDLTTLAGLINLFHQTPTLFSKLPLFYRPLALFHDSSNLGSFACLVIFLSACQSTINHLITSSYF